MISNEERAAHEIRKLEQELENLERVYATMGQGTRWMRVVFVVYIVALLALVLCGVVIENGEHAIVPLAVLIILVLSRFDDRPLIDCIPGSDAKVL